MHPVDSAEELVRKIAERQDRAAFQSLFLHFAPRIKAYLMRTGAPAHVAEDLAQEVMLAIWRKAALFDPAKASVATWVFTIARNLRIDLLRRERRLTLDPAEPALIPEGPTDPGDGLEARQNGDALRHALRSLPPDQARIVMLSFFSDRPHSQIAADLDLPLGTVKSRLRLAMARLRVALGEKP